MSENPPVKKQTGSAFSLTPLPLYQDVPRPLKSLEVAYDPMAPNFSATTGPMTKEAFTQALNGELNTLGIQDASGGITTELLTLCAKDGTYIAPSSDLLTGIRLGWYSKPVPPPVSESFEHAQMDFQREILRMMRDTEERVKRLINTNLNIAQSSQSTKDAITGPIQLRNIQDKDYQMMLWVVCYVFDLAEIKEVVKSAAWEETIRYLISKGWLEWGKRVYTKHGTDRKGITELASRTRQSILKSLPFRDGTISIPKSCSTKYNDMASFSDAIGSLQRSLEKMYGKKKEKE